VLVVPSGEVLPSGVPPVRAARVGVSESLAAHAHGFTEIAIFVSGSADHVSAAGSVRVARKSVVALRPGEWHASLRPEALVIWNVYVGGDDARDLLRTAARTVARTDPVVAALLWGRGSLVGELSRANFAAAQAAARRLSRAAPDRAADSGLTGSTSALGHLLVLLGALGSLAVGAPPRPPHPIALGALRLLDERTAEEWSLARLGSSLGVSPGHLGRLVRAETGLSPLRYLARRRAEEMARLLLETNSDAATIGRLVGWPDPNYASRRFRAVFRLSPTAYRRAFAARRVGASSSPDPPGTRPRTV